MEIGIKEEYETQTKTKPIETEWKIKMKQKTEGTEYIKTWNGKQNTIKRMGMTNKNDNKE